MRYIEVQFSLPSMKSHSPPQAITTHQIAVQPKGAIQQDNRSSTVQARGMVEAINDSPRMGALRQLAEFISTSPRQVAQQHSQGAGVVQRQLEVASVKYKGAGTNDTKRLLEELNKDPSLNGLRGWRSWIKNMAIGNSMPPTNVFLDKQALIDAIKLKYLKPVNKADDARSGIPAATTKLSKQNYAMQTGNPSNKTIGLKANKLNVLHRVSDHDIKHIILDFIAKQYDASVSASDKKQARNRVQDLYKLFINGAIHQKKIAQTNINANFLDINYYKSIDAAVKEMDSKYSIFINLINKNASASAVPLAVYGAAQNLRKALSGRATDNMRDLGDKNLNIRVGKRGHISGTATYTPTKKHEPKFSASPGSKEAAKKNLFPSGIGTTSDGKFFVLRNGQGAPVSNLTPATKLSFSGAKYDRTNINPNELDKFE